MMMNKTIEELEKELSNTKSSLSYYKNKNKPKGMAKPKPKGESPRAKANRLAANIVWNDEKKAMAHVVAFLTANDADYKDAFNQAHIMPVVEVRELVKGHEDEVEKRIKVLQEKREAKGKTKEAAQLSLAAIQRQQMTGKEIEKMLDDAWPDTPAPIPVREAIPKISRRQQMTDKEIEKLHQREKYVAPQKRWGGGQLTADESSVEAIVHVKASTLRLAVTAVESKTGFDGLSKEQVVGHILCRYLQDNS